MGATPGGRPTGVSCVTSNHYTNNFILGNEIHVNSILASNVAGTIAAMHH